MNNLVLDYCFSPSEEYLYFNLSLITNIQAEELEKKLIQIILHKSGIYINNRNNCHDILTIFTKKFDFKELPKKDFFKAAQKIKKKDEIFDMIYATHPFDVIGYDGYNYPYAFSIHDFEPITGRIHLPPPIHQTFETSAFVICSFVPRLYDYHPEIGRAHV